MKKPREETLDEAVEETIPASDPVSPAHTDKTANERKKRGEAQPVPPPLPKRSPDWMFEKK